jgi:hypothetical protein
MDPMTTKHTLSATTTPDDRIAQQRCAHLDVFDPLKFAHICRLCGRPRAASDEEMDRLREHLTERYGV